MRRRYMTIAAVTNVILFAGVCGAQPAPPQAALQVPLQPQQTNNWCWAASGQMVMSFLGKNVSQCQQANDYLGRKDCCASPTPRACFEQGGWPDFAKYGFTYRRTSSTALTWDQVRDQIGVQKKPFAVTWAWLDRDGNFNGGHMMVAYGYYTVNGTRYVSLNDPFPPGIGDRTDVTYEDYVRSDNHTHWDDFYDVSPSIAQAASPNSQPWKGMGQTSKPVDLKAAVDQSRPAATASLDTYRKIVAQKEGPGGAPNDARLGEPMAFVGIGLKDLQSPPGGDPVRALSYRTDKIIYPVFSAERLKSGITLEKKNDGWSPTSYGNAALTKLLVDARSKFAASTKKPINEFYVVSIPSLNTYLVATKVPADVLLMPVLDDPAIELKAGEVHPAKELMPRLAEAAKKHTGTPR